MIHTHHSGCGCLAALSRRNLLGLGLGAAAVAAAGPALAVDDGYEAMLMKCIDPRFTTDVWKYMTSRGWQNQYSQFNIAGGPIAAVAPIFQEWRAAWEANLDISVQLHNVKRLIGMAHRDCGAAALAYGNRIKTDRAFETEMLSQGLRAFRDQASKRQPQLIVELGIMDLNGTVETVS
ncbi:carbonic anhydrase [Reyranella sp.]|uniref:carbonic anhydrase n=1 Tax=Reyranella sp. TaxID=1929291 RepID=UPI003D0CE6B7